MAILKNKSLNVKVNLKALNKHDCVWYTFKKGQDVPEHLMKAARKQGGKFEEKLKPKAKPVVHKTSTTEKKEKKNELDINNDGVVDKKDVSLAAKVMVSSRKKKVSKKK